MVSLRLLRWPGKQVKIEKKNSHSESDSRTSNFAIMQANDSASNRVQSGESLNYDGENYDELHAGVDPLVEHIFTLQSAQEALGKGLFVFLNCTI